MCRRGTVLAAQTAVARNASQSEAANELRFVMIGRSCRCRFLCHAYFLCLKVIASVKNKLEESGRIHALLFDESFQREDGRKGCCLIYL